MPFAQSALQQSLPLAHELPSLRQLPPLPVNTLAVREASPPLPDPWASLPELEARLPSWPPLPPSPLVVEPFDEPQSASATPMAAERRVALTMT